MLATKLRAATAAAPEGAWDLAYAYYDPPANLAWDLSAASATATRSDNLESRDSNPQGLFFKPDGTKMYLLGAVNDSVYEYTLSTAWDTNTASYVQSFSVNAQESTPTGLFFKPDGTKMYVVGSIGDDVNEYTLSTAWDISTASYVQSFSVAAREALPTGLFFKPDGTKMYVVGSNSDNVNEYTLSTAWDVSTASYVQSFSVAAEDATPTDLFFKPDGTKMYVSGAGNDSVYEYTLSTAWDVSTASYFQTFSVSSGFTAPNAIYFSPEGGRLFVYGDYNNGTITEAFVRQYPVGGFSVATQETSPSGLFFKPDGTKMYVSGSSGDDVNEYTLSTAWDIGAASYVQVFSVAVQDTSPTGLFFKPDGTKMYVVGATNDSVYEYTLSTAWDISTASYVQSISVTAQDTTPNGLFFKPDGTKMYLLGAVNDSVYEYTLSTAWDISTASYVQSFSVTAQETAPQGLFFKPDGTKMYIIGSTGDEVNEYTLSTAWDISTASYVQVFSVALQDTSPNDLFFKPDGTKMYIIGNATDCVYSYTLGIPL